LGKYSKILNRRFLSSLAVIAIPLVMFELGFIWLGTWGDTLRDYYSQIIFLGFGVEIGIFVLPDVTKNRWTSIEIAGFCVYPFCLFMIPFIPSYSHGLSIGFSLATTADALFKGIYASDRFLPHLLGKPTSALRSPTVAKYGELLTLLEPFLLRWEAKEGLGKGPSRWVKVETEDRVDLQKSGRLLSDQLLQLNSRHSETWDFGLRNQIGYISEELRKFGVVQPVLGEKELDFTAMDLHGRYAFEAARAVVTWVKQKKKEMP
jgi:hypothetical protein